MVYFAWLVLHNKILTADNMAKKSWGCNPICFLCFCLPESADRLVTNYNFTKALWQALAPELNLPPYNLLSSLGGPVDCVIHLATGNSIFK
jgi:hypothetical protein